MRPCRSFLISLVFLGAASLMPAQKEKRQPLNEVQIDKIREAGVFPDERISLYTKFTDEHADTIKGLTNRRQSVARGKRIDDELLGPDRPDG